MKNDSLIIILLLLSGAVIAYFFGAQLEATSPEGIWLMAPPTDGVAIPSNSFHAGFTIGQFLVSLTYLALSVVIFSWVNFKGVPRPRLFTSLLVSALVGFGLTLVSAILL